MMPKITIVTITFNLIKNGRRDWFIQNLESVHNQTYQDFEHIIIDGASTDGTIELLEEYQNKGYIKYYSEPDDGIYDAMNKGMRRATGEYITYLNSDDFYHARNGLAEVSRALKNDFDYVVSDCTYVDMNCKKMFVQKAMPEIFFIRMPFSHQALFVKTELMRNLGGFDTNFKISGDHDFIIRMMLSGADGIALPHNFITFRLGGISDIYVANGRKEVLKSMENIYSKLTDAKIDYEKLHKKYIVPRKLIQAILPLISSSTRIKLEKLYSKSKVIDSETNKINFTNCVSYERKWYLFQIIPLLRISQTNKNLKVYILSLPVFRKKQTNFRTIYSFFCIPVVTVKYKYNTATCHIFNIPFIKYYK